MNRLRITTLLSTLALASTLIAQQAAGDKVNNWRPEHSQDKTASTNIKIDEFRGLETTGTPAKAVWARNFATAGTYTLRIQYTPLPDRDMTFSVNGTAAVTKSFAGKPGSTPDMACDKGTWRNLGTFKFTEGPNTLVATPLTPDGKLPHICHFEATLQ